jgi:predicted O-methyltransferase YrrM
MVPEPARPRRLEAGIVSAEAIAEYVAEFLPEDEPLVTARGNAAQVGGGPPVSPVVGAALRFMAAAVQARAVVEIGTGCGTSGIWLLRGMRQDGVLTSVDVETEHQRLARRAFTDAGFASNRFRLISGKAADVLPRLTDGGYDLVFCDADKQEYPDYLTAALRLLRAGGIVAFDNALWGGRIADPGQDDPETSAIRETAEQIREDGRLVPLLLPIGDGLLAAVKLG